MRQLLNWPLGLFKCIFDEGCILCYCLIVHCTKGQVGNDAENGKTGSGTDTASGANLGMMSFLFVIEGD
jgi:hypothetical protein